MKGGLLTERQKEVLRYRKQGLTQQQIADIINTSKANVCTIERSALENIRKARETLEFLYTIDGMRLCTISTGMDLLDAASLVYREAGKHGIKVKYDTLSLLNRIRDSAPGRTRARLVKGDIEVYITPDGELYFA